MVKFWFFLQDYVSQYLSKGSDLWLVPIFYKACVHATVFIITIIEFRTLIPVGSKSQSLKYQRFTIWGRKVVLHRRHWRIGTWADECSVVGEDSYHSQLINQIYVHISKIDWVRELTSSLQSNITDGIYITLYYLPSTYRVVLTSRLKVPRHLVVHDNLKTFTKYSERSVQNFVSVKWTLRSRTLYTLMLLYTNRNIGDQRQ